MQFLILLLQLVCFLLLKISFMPVLRFLLIPCCLCCLESAHRQIMLVFDIGVEVSRNSANTLLADLTCPTSPPLASRPARPPYQSLWRQLELAQRWNDWDCRALTAWLKVCSSASRATIHCAAIKMQHQSGNTPAGSRYRCRHPTEADQVCSCADKQKELVGGQLRHSLIVQMENTAG